MLIIKKAQQEDVLQLSALLKDLGYPQEFEHFRQRLSYYLSNENYSVLVACIDEKIVGLVAFAISSLFVSDTKRCHIEALVVDPLYRSQGVGRQLIHEAELVVKERGVTIIELTSSMYRAEGGTHRFYESMGYTRDFASNPPRAYFRKQLL